MRGDRLLPEKSRVSFYRTGRVIKQGKRKKTSDTVKNEARKTARRGGRWDRWQAGRGWVGWKGNGTNLGWASPLKRRTADGLGALVARR